MVITRKSIPRRTFLRGAGAVLALPVLDAMTPAFAAETTRPIRMAFIQVPNGIMNLKNEWTPKSRGRRLGDDPDSRAARGLPRPHGGDVGARSATGRGPRFRSGRRSSARLHRLADGNAREDDLRRRPARRNIRRPDRGEGIRQGDPARLARDRSGIAGSGGRLRVRLWLRLLQHDLVAQRDHAAADGEPPARHLRASVRRRRHDRSEGASGAPAGGPQHPRRRQRGRQAACAQSSAGRIAARSTSIWTRCAMSSGACSWPRSRATARCRRSKAPSALRRSSRNTSS